MPESINTTASQTLDVPARQSEPATEARPVRQPVVSVIIVSYNVKEFLQQCLISIQSALQHIPSEIFVVDNASDDDSTKLVCEQFPDITLIQNTRNEGFARANNRALRQARGQYLVLINPDTIAQEDTFERLIAFMKAHPDAGMVGCKILNPDGSLQLACRRSFPSPWVAFTRLTGLSFLFPKSRLFGRYNLTYLPEDQIAEVDAISGSFMMIRREAFEQVGLLDESFFLYGEDLDWCYRTIQAGWKIYYVPDTQIIHFKGESSKRSRLDSLLIFYQSMARFVKKHFRHRYFFVTYYLLIIAIWLRAAFSFFQNSFRSIAIPLLDLLFMQASLAAAIFIKFGHLRFWQDYLPVNAIYSSVWLISLAAWGSYSRWKFSFFRASAAALTGFMINSAFTYFFKQFAYSRAVVLLAGSFNLLFLGGWRLTYKLLHLLRLVPFKGTLGRTLLERKTLVVGNFSRGEKILSKLKTRIGKGYEIVGLVSLNPDDVGRSYNGLKVLTSADNLRDIVQRRHIQEVIFSTHRIPYDKILKMISECRSSKVNFKLIPSNLEVIIGKASIDQLSDVPLLDVDYRLSHAGHRMMKRMFDFVISSFVLLWISLPYLLQRLRHRQQVERSTLKLGSDADPVEIVRLPGHRILNLVPYLWLVLRGRLALVGREMHSSEKMPAAEQFLKPGLTGLVQVNRDKGLTAREKEKFQLFYLTHYSPLLDLEILIKAILRGSKET
ncbi:MAG: glycosyltransferase [candidate division KSB1 bacterium]|nr:glycosyltransferase [candidate division KSB1 bacterium]MDQ7063152.1 glycosyltransferase [candidate division KSB1 bacterium]